MKTGLGGKIKPFPDTFYISLLALQAILKRNGFSDAIVYRQHNANITLDNKIVDAGIIFNLYSEWGVGKKLEPLIYEIFTDYMIDYETHKDNPFVQEIINISPEAINVIRQDDPKQEIIWCYIYAVKCFLTNDPISHERRFRLNSLLKFSSDDLCSSSENNEDDIIDEINEEEIKEICECKFCLEFRKYVNFCQKDVNIYIIEALQNIDRQISMKAKTTKCY